MNEEWAQMLVRCGLAQNGDAAIVCDNDGESADIGAQLVDLKHFTIVDVTGEDASAFLQGQFCNDLSQVTQMRAQITGYCTPKGRLLALPIIVGTEDGFRMLVLNSVKEGFLKRLRMFVMRSKVEIHENEEWLCTGVVASEDGTIGEATDWLKGLPGGVMDVATSATRQLIRWHDSVQGDDGASTRVRYIVLASVADQIELWNGCPTMVKRNQQHWRQGDIRAGVPSISPGVSEAFVPQMLNLQLIDALSFTKGCYPGQEIVARMQYLGKLKRHMKQFRYSVANTDSDVHIVSPGDSLSSDIDKEAGVVVDAVQGADGEVALLAVMKVSSDNATVNANGVHLVSVDLPYVLPSLVSSVAGDE